MGKEDLLREQAPVDRRDFLKKGVGGFAVAAGALTVAELLQGLTAPGRGNILLAKGVVLVDKQRCSGCRTCEAVCTTHNDHGKTSSSLARIFVHKDHTRGEYEPKTCWQCSRALCVLACPVAALQVDRRSNTNARVIDQRACIGCKQCIEACSTAFSPPRPRYDEARRLSVKCHLCLGEPRCVEFCPYGALRYERSEIGLETGYPIVKEK